MNTSDIKHWLDFHGVGKYTIRDDHSVDVLGSAMLTKKQITHLPFQFGTIYGHFVCSENQLTSLWNSPREVQGDFYCYENQLTTLEHCPQQIWGNFDCYLNQLTSLEHCPQEVGGSFFCFDNPFEVTNDNLHGWVEAIKNNQYAYEYVPRPPEALTNLHKMLWEI